MRFCIPCLRWRPLEKFSAGRGRYRTLCTACQHRLRREADPERTLSYARRWRERNPEKAFEAGRIWREKNPEKSRASTRRWKEKNRETVRKKQRRRRERLDQAPGGAFDISREDYRSRCRVLGDACVCCGAQGRLHMEHGTPVSRGGSNYPANIRPICGPCNSRKYNRTWAEHLLHPNNGIDITKLHPALRMYRAHLLRKLSK